MKTKFCLNKLHGSDKSCKTQSENKTFYALKWPMCDFEKQGSHLIITIKTGLYVEFVRKCIYSAFWNTVVYVYDIIIRYNGPQKHCQLTNSNGNLEILTSILYIRLSRANKNIISVTTTTRGWDLSSNITCTRRWLAHRNIFFRSYSELLSKFGAISFQEYVSKGITHPDFYGDLVYKLRRVKSESNFISSGSKIVKRLRRRQYDPEISERTIGLVLGPFTALYRSFLKSCTLTYKAVGTIWRALSKPPQRRQGPDPRPLWLLVGTPSAFGPELVYRLRVAQPTLMDVPIFLIYLYITIYVCVPFLWPLRGCWSSVSIRRIIYKFFVSFWLYGCCGKWEGWALVNRFNNSSRVTAVTPTDRPKSVRNSCVIKVFGGVLCCHVAFWIFLWV